MTRAKRWLLEMLLTAIVLGSAFLLSLMMQEAFNARTVIPMIFVLGVFLISLTTRGYFWGITASLTSVLAVNYAFTYPYYAIDLITPECLSAAVVMLVVAIMTGMLTTKLKRQEKIKAEGERERMRANLLRAVSHDLRTPLTSIYGSSSAIIENYDTLKWEQKLKLLVEIRSDAEWLIRMVENLLSVTRIDAERVQVKKEPTVLDELIDTVLLKFRKHFPDQEVRVEIPEEFISIPMDALLIGQVLINLLENAVYHAEGMTELILRVFTRDGRAVFEVADNGCGIPADKLERIFSGYSDHGSSPVDGGRSNMGIGLSVCSAIVRAHGGEISVRNLETGGAVFSFSLEMEEQDEQQSV